MTNNMDTLEYIYQRFSIPKDARSPISITEINRPIMAQVLCELGFKVGVEVGVAQGIHARVLCENNPGLKLYCVDCWETYPGYSEYENAKDMFLVAQERLKTFNCELIKKFSKDAAADFADESLDFAYIDGGHDFENVAIDVFEWSKKVRPGGIVFGHDYKQHGPYVDRGKQRYEIDVKDVVQAYCHAKNVKPLFELNNAKRDDIFGRDNPGWLFVRSKEDYICQ